MLQMLQERKLTISELLVMSVEVAKKNLASIIFVSLLFFIPLLIVFGLISEKTFYFLDLLTNDMLNRQTLGQLWLYNIIMMLISVLIMPIGEVFVSIIIKNSLYDEKVSAGKVLLHAFEKGPSIIFSGIVYLICICIGSIFILPGIYLAILWYFYKIAIAVDDKQAIDSLFRSQKLVKGKWWETFGIVTLIGIINFMITFLFLNLGESLILNLIYSLFNYGMSIFMLIFFTLIYFNRKFMLEPCQKPPVQNEKE